MIVRLELRKREPEGYNSTNSQSKYKDYLNRLTSKAGNSESEHNGAVDFEEEDSNVEVEAREAWIASADVEIDHVFRQSSGGQGVADWHTT